LGFLSLLVVRIAIGIRFLLMQFQLRGFLTAGGAMLARAALFLVALLTSCFVVGGTGTSRHRTNNNYQEPEHSYNLLGDDLVDLDIDAFTSLEEALFTKQTVFIKNTDDDEIIGQLLDIYETSSCLLSSPNDFLRLLAHDVPKKDGVIGRSVDRYLAKNQDRFFLASPTINQIAQLADLCDSDEANIAVRTQGLSYVKTPRHYLHIISSSHSGGTNNFNHSFNLENTIFIHNSLPIFEKTNPTIAQVIKVEQYLLYIQNPYDSRKKDPEQDKEIDITISALIALKSTFLNKFDGANLTRLLDSGGETPTAKYLYELNKLSTLAHDKEHK
jgi:hypothetical protein